MTRFHALLRLMLCLCLVLNGSGHALAGAWTHGQAHTGIAMPAAQEMGEGCEESMQHAPATGHAGIAGDPAHASDQHSQEMECCDSGKACDCACQQHSPATLATLLVLDPAVVRSFVPGIVEASTASPRPPRLIRPPIA